MLCSNHYKKKRKKRWEEKKDTEKESNIIHILIWLLAKDEKEEEKLSRLLPFLIISQSYWTECATHLRFVILIWCLVMSNVYFHLFLCRRSLRKKFLFAYLKYYTYQIMVASPIYIWTYEVLSCVKLNATIRSFLFILSIHLYIYIYTTFHQVTPVQ